MSPTLAAHRSYLKNRLNEIYISSSIDSFAMSLISIFIPIYLLQLGYSLNAVLGFFAVQFTSILIAAFIVGKIASRIGLKHTMLIRAPLILIYLIALMFLKTIHIPLPFIAAVYGFAIVLYAIPFHSLFVRCSKEEKMGSEVGKMSSLGRIAGIFAPLVGGIVAVTLGFGALFALGIVLVAVAVVPLFFTAEVKPHVCFKIEDGIDVFKKNPKYFTAAFIDAAGGTAAGIAWPIFVYLTLKNTLSIGIIGTLAGLGAVFFAFFIGNLSDKKDKNLIIKIGAVAMAAIWLFRVFVTNQVLIYVLTILEGFFGIMIAIPLTAITYDLAKVNNIDEFIFFREVALFFGRMLILGLIFVAAGSLKSSFLASSFGYLLFLRF